MDFQWVDLFWKVDIVLLECFLTIGFTYEVEVLTFIFYIFRINFLI